MGWPFLLEVGRAFLDRMNRILQDEMVGVYFVKVKGV
jgi:hypothetical protein